MMTNSAFDRRTFLLATSAVAFLLPWRTHAQSGSLLRPEDFGARGDGTTNDSRAFAALSAEVNRRGGGTILLARGATYIVGEQRRDGEFAWSPAPILEFNGLAAPLRIFGNGARLKCQPGLRFGTFDRRSGAATRRSLPNYRVEELASPYRAMIAILDCRAPIEIRDVELDGNIARMAIGGPYGDTGWQIPGSGLWLQDNRSGETIVNVYSHHHGADGAIIDGAVGRTARSRFSRFRARYNGRQGVSVTGGRGYDFEDCEFSHTGRSVLSSAPGAGVDIEAENGKTIRDLSFTHCKFVDNSGCGMLADGGDSAGARFTDCTFVGTTSWSAWPHKPGFRFSGCTFVGAAVHPFSDKDSAERAARFVDCRFTDDASLSPTGRVFAEGPGGGPIVDLSESDNVLFDRCRFDLTGKAVLPWSWKATYRDCTMSQRSPKTAMTKGRFAGRTTITGPVDLYGSMVEGTLILNGRSVARGPIGVKAW